MIGIILIIACGIFFDTDHTIASDTDDFLDEEDTESSQEIPDPLYYWNKGMFLFNDRLYFWIFKPVSLKYKEITPEPVRSGLKNFFENLKTPIRFINCILQGKIQAAGTELARLIINSTAGVGGFMDAASQIPELNRTADEDLGQTLGVYGIGHGIYIVWPFLGPSSLRDSVRIIEGRFLEPINYVDPTEFVIGLRLVEKINDQSYHIGDYESLIQAAIDPYAAVKNAYFQYRNAKISQ